MRKLFGSLLIVLLIAGGNLYAQDVTTVEAKDADIVIFAVPSKFIKNTFKELKGIVEDKNDPGRNFKKH